MASGRKETLRGYIAPADWDEDDNIRSLLLEADDDKDYIIEYTGPEIDFYDWMDQRVEVTGNVSKKGGKHFVETALIIGLDDEDEDEDDDELDEDDDDFDDDKKNVEE